MKRKWIFGILAVVMVFSMFSISRGADKFYYGGFHVEALSRKCPELRDSLRFNTVFGVDVNGYIDSLASASLQVVAEQGDNNSPTHWSNVSHYTLWEAEGFPGSNWNLLYDVSGTVVDDPYASGGKAVKFTGPGTPRLIQWGPAYRQEFKRNPSDTLGIAYTAEFRLKLFYSLYQPRVARPPSPVQEPVCSIMVVDTVSRSILKAKTLCKSDFPSSGAYKTFTLDDYTVPDSNRIQFRIYWFALPVAIDFRVDYVKVYDQNGWDLIENPTHYVANQIKAYVNQSWVHTTLPDGDTVVYRWYMRDQPEYIDCYKPYAYIDSLLKSNPPYIRGAQFTCAYSDTLRIHEYLLRSNPEEYMVDAYVFHADDTTESNIQQCLNGLTDNYNYNKRKALSLDKDFWVAIQAHLVGYKKTGPCNSDCKEYLYNGTVYCYYLRNPTPNEVRLQTFLAMCYGADAVMNYRTSYQCDGTYLETGLYDQYADTPTQKWEEIKNFTGPRVEKLGPIIKDLSWQGACLDDSVGSFILRNGQPSYIDNIVPRNHFPPYVQVGFFTGPYMGGGSYDYFMLVNRRCLPEGADTFTVFIEKDSVWTYDVQDVYDSAIVASIPRCKYYNDFTVALQPGEGKLFRLIRGVSLPPYVRVGPGQTYATIQAGINAASSGQVVLVDTGIYYENINFRGKSIMVTSKFYTTRDTLYISRTIIDGSRPSHQDSASVVRFVSGEDSCACIKGLTLKNGSGTIQGFRLKNDSDTTHPGIEPTARWGGGILCLFNSSPAIADNIITSNTVRGVGGGIFSGYDSFASSPKIINNVIKGNWADYGGGICGCDPQAIITNNLIVRDTAFFDGGGIEDPCGIITNNTIDRNDALSGGGILVRYTSCQIVNNIITNSTHGGGIYFKSASPPDSTISYNNVWNNTGGNFSSYPQPWGLGDTTWGTNRNGTPCDRFYNIIRDPHFVDGYHLSGSSPCIDAGDNHAPALPPTDFDGNPRVADGDTNGSFFVDMGAYEYQPGDVGGFAKIAGGNGRDSVTKSSLSVPDKFSLSQNYPNPFNPTTVVKFEIVQPAKVSLKIYNILGRLVRVLVDEEKVAGTYTAYWDGNDQNGGSVSSGIYFYKLDAGDFTEVKKMVLIK